MTGRPAIAMRIPVVAASQRSLLETVMFIEVGATFEQVADILGNSPEVVRKRHGKWSKGRQTNIDRLMFEHNRVERQEETRSPVQKRMEIAKANVVEIRNR